MKFEVLKRSNVKRIIIIGVVAVLIISAIVLNFTRAKYRVTQSIPLVNGTINYSLADLNIVGLYIDGVESDELDSSKMYTLDTTQSTCTYKDGNEISNLSISYNSSTGNLSIAPFTTNGIKCTLYFEESACGSACQTILTNTTTQFTRDDFSQIVTNSTTGTIYYADTSKGRTYYFAGDPTDNWVSFAGFYWRIIRINEDGTIRMIYQGTSTNTSGSRTQIGTSPFNSSYSDNMYVGYMYTSGNVHGLGTDSEIKGFLDAWYQNNLLEVADYIDGNAGFCGDRTSTITDGGAPNDTGGTGSTSTYYGARYRLFDNKIPTFDCPDEDNDLYTISGSNQGNGSLDYPIGLITADEVAFAGGVYNTYNASYYLYTGNSYWTMSPSYFSGRANVIIVYSEGSITWHTNGVAYNIGMRPVINLRADVTITGSGTISDPYVVS